LEIARSYTYAGGKGGHGVGERMKGRNMGREERLQGLW
jgi:hypothetical protein